MGPVGVYKGGGLVRRLYSSPQAAVQCRGNMNWSRLVSKWFTNRNISVMFFPFCK